MRNRSHRLACSSLIAVPIAIYYVAFNNLPEDKDEFSDEFQFRGPDSIWKARLISFAVWVALMILVFVPMKLWKAKVRQTYVVSIIRLAD
jgi:archaellum biogenesis protein FlaJ (TadC family)